MSGIFIAWGMVGTMVFGPMIYAVATKPSCISWREWFNS